MVQRARSARIEAPPDVVFSCITEPGLLRRWVGGLRSTERLTEGPLAVGSRALDVVEGMGRTVETTNEVIEIEPGRSLRLSVVASEFESSIWYRITPEADGACRLDVDTEVRLKGVYRLAGRLARGFLERKMDDDLKRLRLLAEEIGAGR